MEVLTHEAIELIDVEEVPEVQVHTDPLSSLDDLKLKVPVDRHSNDATPELELGEESTVSSSANSRKQKIASLPPRDLHGDAQGDVDDAKHKQLPLDIRTVVENLVENVHQAVVQMVIQPSVVHQGPHHLNPVQDRTKPSIRADSEHTELTLLHESPETQHGNETGTRRCDQPSLVQRPHVIYPVAQANPTEGTTDTGCRPAEIPVRERGLHEQESSISAILIWVRDFPMFLKDPIPHIPKGGDPGLKEHDQQHHQITIVEQIRHRSELD